MQVLHEQRLERSRPRRGAAGRRAFPGGLLPGGLFFACLLLGAAPASGAAPTAAPEPPAPVLPSSKDAWIEVQTANFTIYGSAPEKRTLEIARKLERFRAILARLHAKAEVNSPVQTFLFIFKDDAALVPFKTRFEGRPVEEAGYFLGGADGNYIVLNGGSRSDPLQTVYHEFTHYFVRTNLPNAPPWFDEGLAECYSTFTADDNSAELGKPIADHIAWLRSQSLIPLQDLFHIGRTSRDYNEGERRGVFYAQSWALVHYLLWDQRERRPQLLEFLGRLGRGEAPEEAFETCFHTTYPKLQYELQNFVRQSRFLFTAAKFEKIAADAAPRVAPMSRADVLARLGDLAAHLGPEHRDEADAVLRESARVNPSCAAAHAGLGFLSEEAGDYDAAVTHYERALALAPDDYLINFRLGQALLRGGVVVWTSGDPAGSGAPPRVLRARELIGASLLRRQSFAEAYVGLGMTYFLDPDGARAAIRLLEAARTLLPARADIVVNLVSLYARVGDRVHARDLVEGELSLMNNPEALESGRQMLARMEQTGARDRDPIKPGDAGAQESGDREIPPPGPLPEGTAVPGHESTPTDEYNLQVAAYNKAAALANERDYAAAIALLEKTLSGIQDADLAAQMRDLLTRLRKDAARYRKTRPGT